MGEKNFVLKTLGSDSTASHPLSGAFIINAMIPTEFTQACMGNVITMEVTTIRFL